MIQDGSRELIVDEERFGQKGKDQRLKISGSVFTNHFLESSCFILQTFLYLAAFECNTTYDLLNHMV